MQIKILSNSTINKIAAGEVIERPASVVKELVENSLDAGSTDIEVVLECAGKNLILVKDNGFGMSKQEIELAIQRHATSKLDENDLLNINSFGFRGEALPSIGAISKFKLTSKKANTPNTHTLSISGGKIEPTKISSGNVGTTIEVRDLFFATPARLKFLRTDRTELTAITNCIKKIALAHPEISFKLTHDDRQILKTRKQSGSSSDHLKDRISEIIGTEFVENAAEIYFVRDNIKIFGFTSLPTYNRAAADEQYMFINNRPVKDKILNIALKVAYQDYLARNRHPVSVIFLSLDPEEVDVNVHPAKSEVRFHDPNMIRGLVISAIKDALSNSSDRVSNTPAASAISYTKNTPTNSSFKENQNTQNKFCIPTSNFNIPKSNRNISNSQSRTDYALSKASFAEKPIQQIAPKPILAGKLL